MKQFAEMDQAILALTIWREASGEGYDGMVAVASVIYNRAKKANTALYDQCVAINQFTSISVKGDPGTVRWPHQTDSVFVNALGIARGIINGTLADPTGGALFYYNPETATSGWFKSNIVDEPTIHPQTANIGRHVFFA